MSGPGATRLGERWDAGAAVADGPPVVDDSAFLESLREEAGLIVGAVDWVVRTLTGHDLIATVVEPFAGDFPTIASMQQGWRQVGTALTAVGDNHAGLASDLPGAWQGLAAEAAGRSLGELTRTADHQAEAAGLVAEQLGHVMEVSLAAAETVCAALRLIDDIVVNLLAKQLAGPVGTALSAVSLPADVARVVAMVRRAQAAIERVVEVVQLCLVVVTRVQQVLDLCAVASDAVAAAGHARAGAMADDTAEVGF